MELNWTGERLVENDHLGKGIAEHLHRYAISLKLAKNKRVLDIACGEGYGSNLIADYADHVTGIDISVEVVKHANEKYKNENLEYLVGSVLDIPLENSSIDLVVSFETIEHLNEHNEMIVEIKRVLKADGILIISSPEKENYQKVDPDNPYHVKELRSSEFATLLNKYFKNIKMYEQSFLLGSVIVPEEYTKLNTEVYNGSFSSIEKEGEKLFTLYNIAICSDADLKLNNDTLSFFNSDEYYKNYLLKIAEDHYLDRINTIYNTVSYRLGNFLVKPFAKLKQLIKQ